MKILRREHHKEFEKQEEVSLKKEVLNIKELANYIGVSKTIAYRLAHTEGFPVLRIGKRYLFPVTELRKWVAKNTKY